MPLTAISKTLSKSMSFSALSFVSLLQLLLWLFIHQVKAHVRTFLGNLFTQTTKEVMVVTCSKCKFPDNRLS